MSELKLGQKFLDFDHFTAAVNAYGVATNAVFTTLDSKKTGSHQYVKLGCKHYGKFRSKIKIWKGIRAPKKSCKKNCPAFVYAKRSEGCVCITAMVLKHENHDCDPDTVSKFPERRQLEKHEKEVVSTLVSNNIAPAKVQEEVKKLTGKSLSSQDLANLRFKMREQAWGNLNKVKEAIAVLAELLEKDPDAVVILGTLSPEDLEENLKLINLHTLIADSVSTDYIAHSENDLVFIFIQLGSMRQTFAKFPDVVIMDNTYNITETHMPLNICMVMDSHGCGRVISYTFLCDRIKSISAAALKCLKEANPGAAREVTTVVIDKSMSEMVAVNEVLGGCVIVEICLFHALHTLKERTKDFKDVEVKKGTCKVLQSIIYAKSEEDYINQRKLLKNVAPLEYYQYFLDYWDSVKEAWVFYEKLYLPSFGSNTTDEVESINKDLRKVLKSTCSLAESISGIILCHENMKNSVVLHHYESTYKPSDVVGNTDPDVADIISTCTPFAAKLLRAQMNCMEGPHKYTPDYSTCECVFYRSLHLPCKHIFLQRKGTGERLFQVQDIPKRWLKSTSSHREPLQDIATPDALKAAHSHSPAAMSRARMYSEAFEVAKDICFILSRRGTVQFNDGLRTLKNLRDLLLCGSNIIMAEVTMEESEAELGPPCTPEPTQIAEPTATSAIATSTTATSTTSTTAASAYDFPGVSPKRGKVETRLEKEPKMEAEADHSDCSTVKVESGSSEELSSSDLACNTSSLQFPLTMSSQDDSQDTLPISSQDTPLNGSSEYSHLEYSHNFSGTEGTISKTSTLESSLAHPLSSWTESQSDGVTDTTLSELSELPLSDLVGYDHDCMYGSGGSQEAENQVSKDSECKGSLGKGLFQATKFDILKAMKAEVCKVAEIQSYESTETQGRVTLKTGNEEIQDEVVTKNAKVSEILGKEANEDLGTEVSEDSGTKADKDIKAKITQDIGITASEGTKFTDTKNTDFKPSEEIEGRKTSFCNSMCISSKATLKDTLQSDVLSSEVISGGGATLTSSADILVPVNDNVKITVSGKVCEDTKGSIRDVTDVNGTNELVKGNGETVEVDVKGEDRVSKEVEMEVSDIGGDKASKSTELEVNKMVEDIVSKDTKMEVSDTAKDKISEDTEVEISEAVEDKISEDTEVESSEGTEVEISEAVEDKVSEDTVVNKTREGAVSQDTDMEVSDSMEDKEVKVEVSNSMEDKEIKVEVSEIVEDEVEKDTDVQVSKTMEDKINSEKGIEDTEPKLDPPQDKSGVVDQASSVSVARSSDVLLPCKVSEPGTSKMVEVQASEASQEDNDHIEYGCADDSRGDTDSILFEEAKRLDQLNLPSQVTPEPDIPVGELEREMQYKKLVDLLSKSKFYTDVLLRKVEADVVKYSKKRKHLDTANNGSSSDENQSLPSKRKKVLMENQRTMYEIASEVMKNKEKSTNEEGTTESESTAGVKPVAEIKQPKYLIGGTLRDYQLEGFDWLKVLYENGVNGILADEMGLGKTIQVIALLSHLVEMKIKGPFLIVGPLSTLPNWMIEFKRFAPQLHVVLFYGTKAERRKMSENLMRRKTIDGTLCYPIVVTSYEVPVFERAFLSRLKWKYIIVDEGHKIKNYNTLLAKVLRTFDSANRLLLTGTPLQNSLSELWSLLNFLVPEIFDNLDVFESWFRIEEIADDEGRKKIIEEERRKNVLKTLHQILAPFMLRRVKSEVTLDIPKKKEVIVKAPMTEMQLKLYQALLDKNVVVLKKIQVEDLVIPDVDGKRPKRSCTLGKNYEERPEGDEVGKADNGDKKNDIESIITHYIRVKMQRPWVALKQIANHPYLIHYPLQKDGMSLLVDEGVVKSSGKFLVLDAMLEKLHSKGHKVLIFSTLCMLLDVVEDYLTLRNYSYERLDGNVKIADRAEAIQRFNSDPDIFLFLLSTRAGGLGVNLTGADTVIFLDSDWNPQADLQAQDRCHRIGQTKPVMVYRLVTTGTIEEQILKRASAKRVLEKMVISKGTGVQKEFDLEELKSILESKDHSDIVYTDGQVLTDEQLEKLLDRSDLLD